MLAVGIPVDLRLIGGRALKHVGFIGLQVGFDARILRVELRQGPSAVADALQFHLHAGAARLVQAPQRIRRHERMVAVLLPPSPSAIVMLEVIEPLQSGRDLPIQRRQALGGRELQLDQRAGDEQVGQEARYRLLGASVRISRQEIERAEHRSRKRRRERDRDRSRRWIRRLGHIDESLSPRRRRQSIRSCRLRGECRRGEPESAARPRQHRSRFLQWRLRWRRLAPSRRIANRRAAQRRSRATPSWPHACRSARCRRPRLPPRPCAAPACSCAPSSARRSRLPRSGSAA